MPIKLYYKSDYSNRYANLFFDDTCDDDCKKPGAIKHTTILFNRNRIGKLSQLKNYTDFTKIVLYSIQRFGRIDTKNVNDFVIINTLKDMQMNDIPSKFN